MEADGIGHLEAISTGEASTSSFSTFRTSIGRPMRRLNPVYKESVLKPSNPFVLATRRLPPATPCEPGVLTVCCRSLHTGGRRPYHKQYLKMAKLMLVWGTTAPFTTTATDCLAVSMGRICFSHGFVGHPSS